MAEKNFQHNQYLTFVLAGELFACSIASVREIIDATEATQLPMSPPYLLGVINLRGAAVPVVDLRVKFRMPITPLTVHSCVIVTEIDCMGEKLILGALADAVQEVIEFDTNLISPAPRLGVNVDTRFIKGMAQVGDRFCIILDLTTVFSDDELGEVAKVADTA